MVGFFFFLAIFPFRAHVCMSVYPSGAGMSGNGARRWRLSAFRLRVRPVMSIYVPGGIILIPHHSRRCLRGGVASIVVCCYELVGRGAGFRGRSGACGWPHDVAFWMLGSGSTPSDVSRPTMPAPVEVLSL